MSAKSTYFTLQAIDGIHDVKELKHALGTIRGVTSVAVNADTGLVAVDYDDEDVAFGKLQHMVASLGYEMQEEHGASM